MTDDLQDRTDWDEEPASPKEPAPEPPSFVLDPAVYGPEFDQIAAKLVALHRRMGDADRAEAWGAMDGIYESLLGLGRTLGLSTMGYPTLRCCGSGAPPIEKPPARGRLKRLGDLLACLTHCLGIRQCEECKKRQEYANRFRLPF